ncbi:MAG: precorrin-2 C(20)-methyltransferase [Alphaproteobacteria bacterium]
MSVPGTLFGLGVGPGDPELITLKALRILTSVPVIAYPVLGGLPGFARSIVAAHLKAGQREIAMEIPLTGDDATRVAYDGAAQTVSAALDAGDDVAVLCEGDALFYGSFVYLLARLDSRYTCEIIPGVSSLMAAPARLGQAMVWGNDVLAVLPGTLDDATLSARLKQGDAAIIIKVGRHLDRLKALLQRLGLIEHAHYIERATLENEVALPLAKARGEAPYFSMILVHKTGGARQ